MIDYTHFQHALKNLERYWAVYEESKKSEAHIESAQLEMNRMAIVKAFQICYEAMKKVLKRYLIEEIGIADATNIKEKHIFIQAKDSGLLSSPLEQWLCYRNTRNDSTHDYGISAAHKVIDIIPIFTEDMIDLYQTLSEKKWG